MYQAKFTMLLMSPNQDVFEKFCFRWRVLCAMYAVCRWRQWLRLVNVYESDDDCYLPGMISGRLSIAVSGPSMRATATTTTATTDKQREHNPSSTCHTGQNCEQDRPSRRLPDMTDAVVRAIEINKMPEGGGGRYCVAFTVV